MYFFLFRFYHMIHKVHIFTFYHKLKIRYLILINGCYVDNYIYVYIIMIYISYTPISKFIWFKWRYLISPYADCNFNYNIYVRYFI